MTESQRGLKDVLTHQQGEERERALRALLMRPLLAGGSAELTLVRRHAQYLREWLNRETGWVLHVERECARLLNALQHWMTAPGDFPNSIAIDTPCCVSPVLYWRGRTVRLPWLSWAGGCSKVQ